MSAETTLYATLSGAAGVAAIVAARIYPDVVPQDAALPCVGFARAETEYTATIHTAAPVAEDAFFDISCMATTRSGADALADAVVAACGAANHTVLARRADFDFDNQIYATALSVSVFTNL